MVLSLNNGPQKFLDLPLELHFRVRSLLLTDPDTTLIQLRALRLVCKSFNSIYAPVISSHIVLFPPKLLDPPYLTLVQHLRSLVHERDPSLTYYSTLTIKHWHYADTPLDRRSSLIPQGLQPSYRAPIAALVHRLWNRRGPTPTAFIVLGAATGIIILVILFMYIIIGAIIFLSTVIVLILLIVIFLQRKRIKTTLNILRVRFYVELLQRKLDLSNIRRVRLFIDSRSRNWSIHRSTSLLLSLPKLTELELCISHDTDLEYTTKCLAPLNRLHKLSLLSATGISPPHTCCLSPLIAQNENLTHFDYDWRPNVPYDLSLLFRDVAISKPLRLRHLSLNTACMNFEAVVPHIHSLTSFEFHYGKNMWCDTFLRADVFPTTIKVERLDAELTLFIRRHPGIVSLTISMDNPQRQPIETPLFDALYHQVNSLRHLCLTTKYLTRVLCNVDVEMSFLRCTNGLRELVLLNDEMGSHIPLPILFWSTNSTIDIPFFYNYSHQIRLHQYEHQIFPIAARLDRSMTVVIRAQDLKIFHSCFEFCQTSSNPLIRDLTRRLVYEKGSS
ncbi:hypothetical protein JOM56_015583 [Amanita muscaria]